MTLLADENFNGAIVRGLRQQRPKLDIVRAQDLEIAGAPDPDLLEWAAANRRILLTHDMKTMTQFAYERVAERLPLPGVIEVKDTLPIGRAMEEILIVLECSTPEELEGRVVRLPL